MTRARGGALFCVELRRPHTLPTHFGRPKWGPGSHALQTGRHAPAAPQAHHAAREVFLTQLRTEEEVGVLLLYTGVHVLPPRDFFRGGDTLGGDVFLCEYEYDTAWQVGGVVCVCVCARIWCGWGPVVLEV